jgi:hypothetical protein
MTVAELDIEDGAVYQGRHGYFYRLKQTADGLWLVQASRSYRSKAMWMPALAEGDILCVCSKNPGYREQAEAFMRKYLLDPVMIALYEGGPIDYDDHLVIKHQGEADA